MKALLIALALATMTARAADLTPAQQRWADTFVAEKNGDYTNAIAQTKKIISNGGDCYFANLRLAWLNWLNKDATNAAAAYRKASAQVPDSVTPLLGLMHCQVALGQTNDAVKTARSVLQLDPMNYAANQKLGDLFYQRADFATASAYYGKLSALFPEDFDMADNVAWCKFRSGQIADAKTVFENVLIVAPQNASAIEGFAKCSELLSLATNQTAKNSSRTAKETKHD